MPKILLVRFFSGHGVVVVEVRQPIKTDLYTPYSAIIVTCTCFSETENQHCQQYHYHKAKDKYSIHEYFYQTIETDVTHQNTFISLASNVIIKLSFEDRQKA